MAGPVYRTVRSRLDGVGARGPTWQGTLRGMQTVEIVVRNASGLHARPATIFVQAAARYASRVTLENLDRGGRAVDAKSLLLILTAGVSSGHRIRIAADGPDEADAMAGLEAAIAAGLGEPIDGAGTSA